MAFDAAMHRYTPTVAAIDGRSHACRTVRYLRSEARQVPAAVIETMRTGPAARVNERWDARLPLACEQSFHSVTGLALRTEHVDAGRAVNLVGAMGETRWRCVGGIRHAYRYDLAGRCVSVEEGRENARCTERRHYADNHLIRLDDPSGTRCYAGFALAGKPAQEERRFLRELTEPDWPTDEASRDDLLAADRYVTQFQRNAIGDTNEQTDAAGCLRRYVFSVDGHISDVWFTAGTSAERLVSHGAWHGADGQVTARVDGEVTSRLAYRESDGMPCRRLREVAGTVVQDLSCQFDPAGNMLSLTEAASPTNWFAGGTACERSFVYDTLDQLIQASGREADGSGGLRDCIQYYTYDDSGSLTSIRHKAAGQEHTTHFVLDETSHRAATAADEASYGDEGALLRFAGVGLDWTSRARVAAFHDETFAERYGYDADGLLCYVSGSHDLRIVPGADFLNGKALLHIDLGDARLYVEVASGEMTVQAADFHGSNVLEVNSTNVVGIQAYHPHGTRAFGASLTIPYSMVSGGHAGKRSNSLGACNFDDRWYLPALARWTLPDPAGDVDGMDRYRFMAGNAMSGTDDRGRQVRRFGDGRYQRLLASRRSWKDDREVLHSVRAVGIERSQELFANRPLQDHGPRDLRQAFDSAERMLSNAQAAVVTGTTTTMALVGQYLGIPQPSGQRWQDIRHHLTKAFSHARTDLADIRRSDSARIRVVDIPAAPDGRETVARAYFGYSMRPVVVNYLSELNELDYMLLHEVTHLLPVALKTEDVEYLYSSTDAKSWAKYTQVPSSLSAARTGAEARVIHNIGTQRYMESHPIDQRWQLTVRNADTLARLAVRLDQSVREAEVQRLSRRRPGLRVLGWI